MQNVNHLLFEDYIDDTVTELTQVSHIVKPAPASLDDCIENRDFLQNFINQCSSKPNVDLSQTQTLLKLDNQRFEDLIQLAWRATLTARSSRM